MRHRNMKGRLKKKKGRRVKFGRIDQRKEGRRRNEDNHNDNNDPL